MIKAGDRSRGRSPAGPCGEWGSLGLELEDSSRPEVRALLEGGALRVGLGCGGDGGVGPTLVAYLRGAGAGAIGTLEATTVAAAAGIAGALWLAVAAAVGAAAVAVGGGEEWSTRGLKLCPPRVLTMPGLEKERRWRE